MVMHKTFTAYFRYPMLFHLICLAYPQTMIAIESFLQDNLDPFELLNLTTLGFVR